MSTRMAFVCSESKSLPNGLDYLNFTSTFNDQTIVSVTLFMSEIESTLLYTLRNSE